MKNSKFNHQSDKLEISLVIDDDNYTIFELDIKNSSDHEIQKLCNSISIKYNISPKIKQKLFNQISNEISEIIKTREKFKEKEIKSRETVNRLYYESIERCYKKQNIMNALKKEKIEESIKKFSFTPTICKQSNELKNRNHFRIEERLYYDYKQVKEKNNLKKLIKTISDLENNQERIKPYNFKTHKNEFQFHKEEKLNDTRKVTTVRSIQDIDPKLENKKLNLINNIVNNDDKECSDSTRTAGFNAVNNIKTELSLRRKTSTNENISSNNNFNLQTVSSSNFNKFGQTTNLKKNSYSEKYEMRLQHKNIKNSSDIVSSSLTPKNGETNYDVKYDFVASKGLPEIKTSSIGNMDHTHTKLTKSSLDDSLRKDLSLLKLDEDSVRNKKKSYTLFNSNQKENNYLINTHSNAQTDLGNNVHNTRPLTTETKIITNKNLKTFPRSLSPKQSISKKKHQILDEMKRKCSFTPELSVRTKNIMNKLRKREDKNALFERLYNSKLKKVKVNQSCELNSLSPCTSLNSKILKKSKSNKHYPSEPQSHSNTGVNIVTSTADLYHKVTTKKGQTIRHLKSERNLYNDINNLKQTKSFTNKIFQEKFKENINKFKLNNLKELYELVNKNFDDNLNGVPSHIKEKILFPTCSIIKNRNLEFNFHNFYSIASEILDKCF